MTENQRFSQADRRYWRANLVIMGVLLIGWAGAGLGAGILLADFLNRAEIPGTGLPLGFWMAHQGSIIVFVLIILTYCVCMNILDRRHRRDIENVRDGDA